VTARERGRVRNFGQEAPRDHLLAPISRIEAMLVSSHEHVAMVRLVWLKQIVEIVGGQIRHQRNHNIDTTIDKQEQWIGRLIYWQEASACSNFACAEVDFCPDWPRIKFVWVY
jgi:hypothetical protein